LHQTGKCQNKQSGNNSNLWIRRPDYLLKTWSVSVSDEYSSELVITSIQHRPFRYPALHLRLTLGLSKQFQLVYMSQVVDTDPFFTLISKTQRFACSFKLYVRVVLSLFSVGQRRACDLKIVPDGGKYSWLWQSLSYPKSLGRLSRWL